MGRWFLGKLTRGVLIVFLAEVGLLAVLAASGSARNRPQHSPRELNRRLVQELGLTDLALSSGTSYTRHPSQADFFAAHGDHPAAMEHFPAGSIVPPPVSPIRNPHDTTSGAGP